MCVCVYLYGAQFVLLARIVVNHHDKIIANVALLIAAALVALPVWHQCSDMEDSYTHTYVICSVHMRQKKLNIIQCSIPIPHLA